MPKTYRSSSKVRASVASVAPYVPLRGWNVFAQLALKKEQTMLCTLVQQFGGVVASVCDRGVNTVVTEDGGVSCSSQKVQAYVEEWPTTTVIEKEDMVQQLQTMCTNMCPLRDGSALPGITYHGTVFPIRVANFPRMNAVFPPEGHLFEDDDFAYDSGVTMKMLRHRPEVDLLYVVDAAKNTDVWDLCVEVHRHQITVKKNGKTFYAIKTRNTLFNLCHCDFFSASFKKFKSMEKAVSFLLNDTPFEGETDLHNIKPGRVESGDEEQVVEVLRVCRADDDHEPASDYEPVSVDEDCLEQDAATDAQ